MKSLRINEPKDPELFTVSKVVPDRWIDERWPMKTGSGSTRVKRLSTSQLVRVHLLALLKGLGSFNRVSRELKHNTDFRRFCRLRKKEPAPAAATLSEFRDCFGLSGWRDLHVGCIGILCALFPPPALGVCVMDSCDLPVAVRRTWKKKTIPQ